MKTQVYYDIEPGWILLLYPNHEIWLRMIPDCGQWLVRYVTLYEGNFAIQEAFE